MRFSFDKIFIYILVILFAGIYPDSVQSQSANNLDIVAVSVIVRDSTNSQPLFGATVFISGMEEAAYTDEQGIVYLEGISVDENTLTVVYPGYYRWRGIVRIRAGGINELIINLVPSEEFEPMEIDVEAEYTRPDVSRRTIQSDEIQSMAGTQGDVVRAVVSSLPGIVMPSSIASGNFVVRGGDPEDNLIYFDNMRLLYPFHFGGFASIIHPEAVQSIDFYAGGFPAGFGNKTGSVMDIISKYRDRDRVHFKVNINLLTSDFFLETPLGDKWYLMVSGRRSYFDLMLEILPIDIDITPYFWDYMVKLSFEPNQKNYFNFIAIGAYDEVTMNIGQSETDEDYMQGTFDYNYNFYTQGFNWKWIPREDFYSLLTVYHTYSGLYLEVGTDPDSGLPFFLDIDSNYVNARWNFTYHINESYELQFGPFITTAVAPYSFRTPRVPGANEIIYDFTQLLPAVTGDEMYVSCNALFFARMLFHLDPFEIDAGMEVNYFTAPRNKVEGSDEHTEAFYVSPRVNMKYTIIEQLSIHAAGGLYFQNPQPTSIIKEFGNPLLGPSSSWHAILGVLIDPTDTTNISVEGYYKSLNGKVVVDESASDLQGYTGSIYVNEGYGYAYGFEIYLKQDLIKNFSGWISYTYSVSMRNDGFGDEDYYSGYDQTHILTLVLSYQPLTWLRFGIKWRLNSGLPYTGLAGRYVVLPFTSSEPTYYPIISSVINGERYPVWHQLDFRMDFFWDWGDYGKMSFFIDVMNLYYQKNVIAYGYQDDYSNYLDPSPINDLPIIPSIGIEYEY